MQRLVDLVSMVTNSTLLCYATACWFSFHGNQQYVVILCNGLLISFTWLPTVRCYVMQRLADLVSMVTNSTFLCYATASWFHFHQYVAMLCNATACWFRFYCNVQTQQYRSGHNSGNKLRFLLGSPQHYKYTALHLRCTACFPCSPPNGNVGNFVLH
jgi:hypothetical protein